MPVLSLETLVQDESLIAIAGRLAALDRGLVLVSGQAMSGKLTMLGALAQRLAGPGQHVALLTDRPEDLRPFDPFPQDWHEVHVEPTVAAWDAAFDSRAVAEADLLVVAPLGRGNAASVIAQPPGRWILATVDTALIGMDTAYALHQMGIDNAAFVDRVRCVWSQFLIEKLCVECSQPAQLSAAELAHLFPTEPALAGLRVEVGCPACKGRGTKAREAICEALLITGETRATVSAALADGMPLQLEREWHVTAHDHARRLVAEGIVGVGTYRSEIRRNPLLRARNTIEREQSRAFRLDIASRHKSEFLANMSHELRTPLNAIIGFSDVMLNGMAGPVAETHKEFIEDIRDSGKHLLALINDILDLSKIEAGRMELDVTRFDLPAAIENAMTLVRGRAERQGISLDARIGPGVGEYEGDERKFKQIALNLLTNAVKFTPSGGAVTLTAARGDDGYEISVKDTGIGIAAEDLDKVFEEFRQVGTDAARKAEGTGLGLTLTRRLVELHGGTIGVTSEPGQGSCFSFNLPSVARRRASSPQPA
jgi:signal transduction histidine kinase